MTTIALKLSKNYWVFRVHVVDSEKVRVGVEHGSEV
jgi:hypothetical protein